MEWPKITKETPLEEIKAIHQRIWDYVIEHGKKPDTPYHGDCAACEYDNVMSINDIDNCSKCPIAWPGDVKCGSIESLYRKRCLEQGLEKEIALARQIRDTPFKYELESQEKHSLK